MANNRTERAAPVLLATWVLLTAGLACGEAKSDPTPIPVSRLTPNAVEQTPVPRGDRLLGIDVTQAEDGEEYDVIGQHTELKEARWRPETSR